jgi:hypothetical protein
MNACWLCQTASGYSCQCQRWPTSKHLTDPYILIDSVVVPSEFANCNDDFDDNAFSFAKEFMTSDLSTMILMGETGCGKSTQIPQIVYELQEHCQLPSRSKMIGITEVIII